MQGWIVSHLEDLPSVALLCEAAHTLGHALALVHPRDCLLDLRGGRPPRAANAAADPDFAITRLSGTAPGSAIAVVRALEGAGVTCLNTAESLERVRDKVRMAQALAAGDAPMPESLVPNEGLSAAVAFDLLGGAGVVVKVTRGSKGAGVMLCESVAALQGLMDMLRALGEDFLLQRAVTESFGVDVRVLVLQGRAVAAMRRRGARGDFRANLHAGGTAEASPPTPAQRSIAEAAAIRLGLDIAGVDLLESASGPLLIEVNGSPGLAGISEATGLDLASEIVRMVVARASRGWTSAA